MTIVYLTLNLINYKIYIGIHDCNPDVYDYYLGLGCYANRPSTYNKKTEPFACALRKYGPNNFRRITLARFETRQEAIDLERKLVNEEFIKRSDTYNITIGGGDPPRADVTFYKYDIHGNYIEECKNMSSTCRMLNISHDRILSAIKQKKSCENCFWSYEKKDKLDLSEYTITNRGNIQVFSKEGHLLYEFNSIKSASKELDIDESIISNSLFRRSCSTGYYFLRGHESISYVMNNTISEKLLFYCYNKDGELVAAYNDINQALSSLKDQNAKMSGLKSGIFKEKKYKGFYWSQELYDNFHKKSNPKKICQYDLDGNLVKI